MYALKYTYMSVDHTLAGAIPALAPLSLCDALMMMIPFICSCRNNNQPNAIHPWGTFPRGLKKAHVMMLPSFPLWYHDDPFFPLVDGVVR